MSNAPTIIGPELEGRQVFLAEASDTSLSNNEVFFALRRWPSVYAVYRYLEATLGVSAPVPTNAELAELLTLSVPTIKRAVRALTNLGLVRIDGRGEGRGALIYRRPPEPVRQALAALTAGRGLISPETGDVTIGGLPVDLAYLFQGSTSPGVRAEPKGSPVTLGITGDPQGSRVTPSHGSVAAGLSATGPQAYPPTEPETPDSESKQGELISVSSITVLTDTSSTGTTGTCKCGTTSTGESTEQLDLLGSPTPQKPPRKPGPGRNVEIATAEQELQVEEVLTYFLAQVKERCGVRWTATSQRRDKIRKRIAKDGCSVDQLKRVIDFAVNSDWHRDNARFDVDEIMGSKDKVERNLARRQAQLSGGGQQDRRHLHLAHDQPVQGVDRW